jgi:hypothetical protein
MRIGHIPTRYHVVSLASAAFLMLAVDTDAQTAERPTWRIGDTWSFRARGGLPAVDSVWSRRVSQEVADDKFEVIADGKKLIFDNQGNSLDRRGPEYSWHRFDFPMFVGKEWKHSRKIAGGTWAGYETSAWHVVAYESVTVPAGTFQCFRVDGDAWANWSNGMSLIQSTNRRHTLTTYWYCPAVSWVAKWVNREQAFLGSPYIESTSELTSFDTNHQNSF